MSGPEGDSERNLKLDKLNETVTRKVAELARLELSPEEVTVFTGQLAQILEYVDQLAQVNVDGVEPLTQPSEEAAFRAPLREDVARRFERGVEEEGGTSGSDDFHEDGYRVPAIREIS